MLLLPGAVLDSLLPLLQLFQASTWAPGQPLDHGLVQALRDGQPRLALALPCKGCPDLGLASFNAQDVGLFFDRRRDQAAQRMAEWELAVRQARVG